MTFSQYCKDKWVSIFLFVFVLMAGGGLLWLVDTPFAAACVAEGFYAAGFLLMLVQEFLSKKEFYDKVLEASEGLEEISYLSDFLSEPQFQEGQILYQILKQDEKYMNDRIASHQRELQEYKAYVEIWVHEVKTPIAVSRLIMENNRDPVTRSLSQEMDKLEGFVEQMLYYSKSSSLQEDYIIRPVELKELVMGAVKEHATSMISEKVTPKFGCLDYVVLTDSKWMRFILGQIISNGVKYHAGERKPELVFSAEQAEKTVTLSISDNGIGIPAEDVSRVTRKGFTGRNGRKYAKSTGMGLYLCDTLCGKLGSALSVSSTEGEGTVVTICFTSAQEAGAGNISKM